MGLSAALGPVLDRHPILRDSAIFLKKTTKAVEGNEAVYIPYILLYLFFFCGSKINLKSFICHLTVFTTEYKIHKEQIFFSFTAVGSRPMSGTL